MNAAMRTTPVPLSPEPARKRAPRSRADRIWSTVLFAAPWVRLWRRKFREADVVFMQAENAHRHHDRFWAGADLVMEVVSPGQKARERDLKTKREEYAR